MSTQDTPNSAHAQGQQSKATTPNPKDLFGSLKVSLTKLPAVAVAHAAHAMMDGAEKYGPYNWRDKKVLAGIYVDAAKRHLDAWFERERDAKDSGVHHLGHVMACCAILLDAEANGVLIDDRPKKTTQDALTRAYALISEKIQYRRKEKEQKRVDQSWGDAAYQAKSPPPPLPGVESEPHYYRRQFDNTFSIFTPKGLHIFSFVDEDQAANKCRELDMQALYQLAKKEAKRKEATPRFYYRPTPDGFFEVLDRTCAPGHVAFLHKATAKMVCQQLNAKSA